MHRVHSWARTKAHGPSPLSEVRRSTIEPAPEMGQEKTTNDPTPPNPTYENHGDSADSPAHIMEGISKIEPQSAETENGESSTTNNEPQHNIVVRFYLTTKAILCSSYVNVLLVFVPVGIAADLAHLNASIIFSMNAIAIIPLAGLLSHATESVAKRMGDTIGALMNVTFGNAVELIIFIIALTKNEIRIVQASLLGSILANLLLILGMAFTLGGLRFREQAYNSTVTQMSACLLSLSVMSLVLPTAFHASFGDIKDADKAVLKVSRGTSVILLLVYGLYLLFQLRSHAYMYESTPQHIIDEASQPGPAAGWMDSSSSDSSSSDSDDSTDSNTTTQRIKRVLRHRRRRSSSSSSDSDLEKVSKKRTKTNDSVNMTGPNLGESSRQSSANSDIINAGDDEDINSDIPTPKKSTRRERARQRRKAKHDRKRRHKERKQAKANLDHHETPIETTVENGSTVKTPEDANEPRRVDFAVSNNLESQPIAPPAKRPFNLYSMTMRPGLPKLLSENVFTQPLQPATPYTDVGNPRTRQTARRAKSLPDTRAAVAESNPTTALSLHSRPSIRVAAPADSDEEEEENISRTTAVILLLVSTGLVAVCADFMVEAIDEVTTGTGLSVTFVGLIILPVVGNAAEHVTAVTVAAKNKMDLAIGVAVGSSIQIALFVTPFVVLLGWCMDKDMTLYFTLFETVSLFVSAFIVNFLVLDGRSNYLEGALLMAAYIIIAVAAFFYPEEELQSVIGGNPNSPSKMIRSLVGL